MQVEPLNDVFGARVTGISVAQIDDATFDALYQHWLTYGVLVFPEQFLDRKQQVAFAERFGKLEFAYAEIGNMKKDGSLRPDDDSDDMMKINRGNMGWHHDSTYMPVQAKGAVFSAEICPDEGGATGFADMRAAYDALPNDMRDRIAGLHAHHSLYHSQKQVGHDASPVNAATVNAADDSGKTYGGYGFHDGPVSIHPLVKTHPETGRKNLLIGRHAYDIIGMTTQDSEDLLTELNAFASQPRWSFHHQWAPGDAVVWDNRRLMHRATPWPFDQRRRMWHSRIAGDPATESALLPESG